MENLTVVAAFFPKHQCDIFCTSVCLLSFICFLQSEGHGGEILWFDEERTGIRLTSYFCHREVYIEVRVYGKELKDVRE